MFEQPVGKEEKDRSRAIMVVSGAAVLAVIALIVVVTQLVKPSGPVEMARVYPVYDPETQEMGVALLCPPRNVPQTEEQSYVPKIRFTGWEKKVGEYENFQSKYMRILCTVRNAGERTIGGLKLRMVLFDEGCNVIKEKIITPIPERQSTLEPGQAIPVDVTIDQVPNPEAVTHMRLEPYALKLK
ncbi:MAG TPA: hypothetical protein VNN73_00250 [Blastocatellia bacterium]|nr:hypothetical protein [Blastocatellia bacterium]